MFVLPFKADGKSPDPGIFNAIVDAFLDDQENVPFEFGTDGSIRNR